MAIDRSFFHISLISHHKRHAWFLGIFRSCLTSEIELPWWQSSDLADIQRRSETLGKLIGAVEAADGHDGRELETQLQSSLSCAWIGIQILFELGTWGDMYICIYIYTNKYKYKHTYICIYIHCSMYVSSIYLYDTCIWYVGKYHEFA